MAAGLKMSLSGFPHQEHFTTMRGADRGNQETTHCKLIFQILWNPICCSSNNDPVIRRKLGVALLAVSLDDHKLFQSCSSQIFAGQFFNFLVTLHRYDHVTQFGQQSSVVSTARTDFQYALFWKNIQQLEHQ